MLVCECKSGKYFRIELHQILSLGWGKNQKIPCIRTYWIGFLCAVQQRQKVENSMSICEEWKWSVKYEFFSPPWLIAILISMSKYPCSDTDWRLGLINNVCCSKRLTWPAKNCSLYLIGWFQGSLDTIAIDVYYT